VAGSTHATRPALYSIFASYIRPAECAVRSFRRLVQISSACCRRRASVRDLPTTFDTARDVGLIAGWRRDGGGRLETAAEAELPTPEGTLAPSAAYRALFGG
jgi:hypothetical protein